MTQPKVLISDKMDPKAAAIFKERGIQVDEITGKTKDELIAIIGDYDGLAIRSATKVTADVLAAATNLKVVGRAGIGVDNIDIPAASAKGVVVMNTPFGNSITTAEHAVAMMFALARQIPDASARTRQGKWPKNDFMGVELTQKTLGLIGCGNIGSIVAERALGLRMKVVAFDPFLTPERAIELGVEKVDLDTLLARADFKSRQQILILAIGVVQKEAAHGRKLHRQRIERLLRARDMAQRAEDGDEIAIASLDLANAGKGGEGLVAGRVEPLAQAGELFRPVADRRACRLQRVVRCADRVHYGGKCRRVQMPPEEA